MYASLKPFENKCSTEELNVHAVSHHTPLTGFPVNRFFQEHPLKHNHTSPPCYPKILLDVLIIIITSCRELFQKMLKVRPKVHPVPGLDDIQKNIRVLHIARRRFQIKNAKHFLQQQLPMRPAAAPVRVCRALRLRRTSPISL